MFWTCTKIQTFWVNVMDEIVALLGYNLELSPLECILAAKVDNARNNTKLVGKLLYIERKTILKFWISEDAPGLDDWYKGVLRVLPLEKLTYTRHENAEGFIDIWQPVLDVVDPSGLTFALSYWRLTLCECTCPFGGVCVCLFFVMFLTLFILFCILILMSCPLLFLCFVKASNEL